MAVARCPACGQEFKYPADAAGRTGTCPRCRKAVPLGPPPPAAAGPRTLVGDRYELVQELGRGAFGVVYKARDTRLHGKWVAVKMLLERALATPDAVRRFQAEAKLLCGVRHAHVPDILDLGEYGGQQYIVFAFIDGKTVREAIPPGGFADPVEAVRLAVKLTRTLHDIYAAKAILHRDVKPANMMLPAGEQDGLYLMDFGLAVCHDTDETRTTEGTLLGTPFYMSPEQAAGRIRDTGHTSDLYAAAAVLYHLLTGRPPFDSKMPQILYDIQRVPAAPPSAVRPGLDPRLDPIVLRGLAKRARDRYQTGAEFAEALDGWVVRVKAEAWQPQPVAPAPGRRGSGGGSAPHVPVAEPAEAESVGAESTAGGLPLAPPPRPVVGRPRPARGSGTGVARSLSAQPPPRWGQVAAKVGVVALALALLAGGAYGLYAALTAGGKPTEPTSPQKDGGGKIWKPI
ncbi:MAG: hypothetical protein C0501_11165 [Isosphaera sp.]|nr:hypothetical protein [Isosphaera sp.]